MQMRKDAFNFDLKEESKEELNYSLNIQATLSWVIESLIQSETMVCVGGGGGGSRREGERTWGGGGG